MAFQLARRRGNYPISARFGHPVFDGTPERTAD